jgi:hypothetical protein
MRTKTTHVFCNSQDPESRPPVQFTDLAIEDLTDTPVFTLTPTGRAEIALEDVKSIPLTDLLVECLKAFTNARRDREQAAKGDLDKYIRIEDTAALTLAWAFEQAVNQEQ